MKPQVNRHFLQALHPEYQKVIVKEFSEGKVTFQYNGILRHLDGSELFFNNSYFFEWGKDFIVLTEHLGYFVFSISADLSVFDNSDN